MQSKQELYELILAGRPDISTQEASTWARFLVQLKGCHLFSVASPEKDQKEWLKERTAGIGGSEIAAIMGENHWSSPRQIWMSKMGMFDDKPPQQSESARWGNLLETTVATEWGLRNNRKWVHIPVILQSDESPWLLANIDGFTLDDTGELITGILEIKTTSAYNLSVWEDGPLPYHYICQANWYAGITGLDQYDLVCLVGGQKLFGYTMPADAAIFAKEKAAAEDFWLNYVKKGIEPEATDVDKGLIKNTEDTQDETLPPVVLEDAESERLTEAYCQLREKIGTLTKVKDALYAQIFLLLGKSTQALTTSHTIVLSKSARRSCNFDLLMDKYPEAYHDCISVSISNSLRIK
jgi:putative phage-type endonuclease